MPTGCNHFSYDIWRGNIIVQIICSCFSTVRIIPLDIELTLERWRTLNTSICKISWIYYFFHKACNNLNWRNRLRNRDQSDKLYNEFNLNGLWKICSCSHSILKVHIFVSSDIWTIVLDIEWSDQGSESACWITYSNWICCEWIICQRHCWSTELKFESLILSGESA